MVHPMTTLTVATPRPRPLISWRVRKLLIGYSYLVPAALCLLATVVVPIFFAIKMSLYADVLYKPQDYRFIGLGNYIRLLHDPVFWLTLWNSVIWVFGSVILQFIFGFAAALLLQQAFRGRALVRTLTLLPWIIPGVVVGLIWQWLYQPNYGVLNDLLLRLGVDERTRRLAVVAGLRDGGGGLHQCLARHSLLRDHAARGPAGGAGRTL